MRVLAVDLGASSIRIASVDLDAPYPKPYVLHRWQHGPIAQADGSLRWDWSRIVAEVKRGLEAGLKASPVASIGVDGWGVDYGLLDADGRLLSPPYSYRDPRTAGWRKTADRIGADRLYQLTGVELMPINTIFQLAAHDRNELRRAARVLLLPDLLVHHLTGYQGAERSNASTTALMDAATGSWSPQLLEAVGVAPSIVPPITAAGRNVGTWHRVPVHLVGSHDTASAFVAVPGLPDTTTAIVSCGTWVLVGVERAIPDTSEAAQAANFSNERRALGGVQFLKNVMGLWLLEECRRKWGEPPVDELVDAAARTSPAAITVDLSDERFLAPRDMEAEIRAAAGLGATEGRAVVVRCILESIAAATARVVDELGTITGHPIQKVMVVGGGVRIRFMNELLAHHCGMPVIVGSPEATAIGNAAVQGIALGRFSDLDDARRWVATNAAHIDAPVSMSDPGTAKAREG